jgi:hypothetical protein
MSRPRTRFHLPLLVAGAVLALVAVAGCQASSTGAPTPSAPDPLATADTALALADANTGAVPTDAAPTDPGLVDPTPDVPPAPTLPPTPRPTPRPLPTPIPATQALEPAATSLETKLSAFRTALKTQDVTGSLRLQRELLAATSDAESALKNDKSPQAQSVRSAIVEIRAGVAGDNNGLEQAAAALRQAIGGASGGLGVTLTSDTSSDPVGDLHTLNGDLHALQQAIQSKNSGDALRVQAKLVAEMAAAQKLAASDGSDQGRALTDALALLQKGLDGDATALVTAGMALDKLDTGPQAQAAPDYAGLAASLAAKMDAFQTATSTASQADLLRLQQEILSEAAQDDAALGSDQSAQAAALRSAINGARASVSGDLSKLDTARSDLGKVSGQAASSGASTAKPIADIKGFAGDLDSTVGSFQVALQKNDTGTMLRLQKSLADQADQADTSLKGVQSKPAEQVLAAVASIRSAFAGDTSKLADARMRLRLVSGASPTPGPTTTSVSPNTPGYDPRVIAGGVRDRLTTLSASVHDPRQSADEIAKQREALNAEALKAEAALKGVTDPRADRLRSALTTAREGAAGDDAKLQSALSGLQAALNNQ